VTELQRRGHRAIAVDLPIEDEDAGATEYAQAAAEAARAQLDGPLVAVGHSLAGIVIPLLPQLVEIQELVFLCALLPMPGKSLVDQFAMQPEMAIHVPPDAVPGPGEPPASPELAVSIFYADCPDALAHAAVGRLRHQAMKPVMEPTPISSWPAVPFRYILGRDDRVINRAWARTEVPRRLGEQPIELAGGHSPFLARPVELADVLLEAPVREEVTSGRS
jgi:hypothetical protein